jgi:hypothetical protein
MPKREMRKQIAKCKNAEFFFKRSARNGPTPFRYSMGVANMFDEAEIIVAFLQK